MSVTVVFFGNSLDPFSNRLFQALVDTPAALAAVVDAPPSTRVAPFELPGRGWNFVQRANRRQVPVFEPEDPGEPGFIESLRALSPDLFVAAGYRPEMPKALLAVPHLVAANCHPSLLPAFRGHNPVLQTLRSGDRLGGLTIHTMTGEIGAGPILYQARVRTRGTDSVADLAGRIMETADELMAQLIADAEVGRLRAHAQAETDASSFPELTEDDYRLDWRWPARRIGRWVTASPGECFFEAMGKRVYVMDAERVRLQQVLPAGALAYIGRNSGTVATGEDGVRIREVRPADERGVVMFNEWLREQALEAGDALS